MQTFWTQLQTLPASLKFGYANYSEHKYGILPNPTKNYQKSSLKEQNYTLHSEVSLEKKKERKKEQQQQQKEKSLHFVSCGFLQEKRKTKKRKNFFTSFSFQNCPGKTKQIFFFKKRKRFSFFRLMQKSLYNIYIYILTLHFIQHRKLRYFLVRKNLMISHNYDITFLMWKLFLRVNS